MANERRATVVVIGSGFGGTISALSLAREFLRRGKKGADGKPAETVHMLERGTWWTTPVGTVRDKDVGTERFLREKGEPVQFWSAADGLRGLIDLFTRCLRRKGNEKGLYDFATFGRTGFLGIGSQSDGVGILRASGVGGGSLVYANITMQPPSFIFDDGRWPAAWATPTRDEFYGFARKAIGSGVVAAWDARDAAAGKPLPPYPAPFPTPADAANQGLANIVTRSARLDPHWNPTPSLPANEQPKRRQIALAAPPAGSEQTVPGGPHADPQNELWIDRARIFQTAMSRLTKDYGTVDSAISDLVPENGHAAVAAAGGKLAWGPRPGAAADDRPPYGNPGKPPNTCERQGRCNIGCLPGARYTLNKQLLMGIHGPFDGAGKGYFDGILSLEALAEVDVIEAMPDGRYKVRYVVRSATDPSDTAEGSVIADKVVVAAGCVGTNEILLRSKARGALPRLSDQLGHGFSTNGDYIGFLEGTEHVVSLTRGPVTTSFGHFHTNGSAWVPEETDPTKIPASDPKFFHTIEDQGIPRSLATLVGVGVPWIRRLSRGPGGKLCTILALAGLLLRKGVRDFFSLFKNHRERQDVFRSDDEVLAKMMSVACVGRSQADGVFRLGGGWTESPLRVSRPGNKPFWDDPIYPEIRKSLSRLATVLLPKGVKRPFVHPSMSRAADKLEAKAITLTHALGGCRMAADAAGGVVDEFGRAFGHEGLYVADASIIPTSLGVNPSLTISALTLRVADQMIKDLP